MVYLRQFESGGSQEALKQSNYLAASIIRLHNIFSDNASQPEILFVILIVTPIVQWLKIQKIPHKDDSEAS